MTTKATIKSTSEFVTGASLTADALAVFNLSVSDEALETSAGDYAEVKCSQCGGSCTSKCSTSTR